MLISALQHKSKYKSNSISNFFEKKNQIFWFPCCSTCEDHSVEVSITYVGLILTKLGDFFSRRTETRGTDKIQFCQFRTFLKKIQILGFPCCSIHEDLSIDVSITNVGLTLTKPGQFLFSAYRNSGYGQNSIQSISNFFEKKNRIFGFQCCSTREDLSIDVSITNVGLLLMMPGQFLGVLKFGVRKKFNFIK